jgi:ubiquinone/menaquinone biosynthesis C-methylase UbiE
MILESSGMATITTDYVLTTTEAELVRLGIQHRLWSEFAFGAWERAGFGLGQTIIDVGCGPGYASFDLAQLVGAQGRVLAIDESARFIEHLQKAAAALGLDNIIDARVGDVRKLGLDGANADGAYARWVLCFVDRPEDVVAGVAWALKRGGRFVVQDYYHYEAVQLGPPAKILDTVIAAVKEAWLARAGDPQIGLRLPAMMVKSGLRVRWIRPMVRIAHGGSEAGFDGSPLWNWPKTFFTNFLPVLEGQGLLTAAQTREFLELLVEYSRREDAFFASPPMVEIVGEKE